MFKLFNRKLNKKGFTLAELLVVIAILAILIAIAIPVFTGMVADAQLRVNQANIRSVRSAAVAKILTNLHEKDDSAGDGYNMNLGTQEGAGWVALAKVNNAGDVDDLEVYVRTSIDNYDNGIIIAKNGDPYKYSEKDGGAQENALMDKTTAASSDVFNISTGAETTTSKLAGISPTSGSLKNKQADHYVVQCVIKDIDINNKPDTAGT